MNWIDRAVSYVSPLSGVRRQQARKVLERTDPSPRKRYASDGRNWGINTGNPDDARPRRVVDRMAILKLIAENPFARKAMNALLNSLVGWGITGAPQGSKKVKDSWAEWVKICDFMGQLDLYGIQELAIRSMLRDGEVFIVQRFVRGVAGIPMRLQLFDKGMLAIHKAGTNIERGIEYDNDGRPVRYHFVRGRPGKPWASQETIDFPAADVIHLFVREWIGQTEGVSIFDSVAKRLGDVDEGVEAEVVKANISACMVGFRYRAPGQVGEDPNIGMPVDSDPDRPQVEEFTPGMIETLDAGEQITFSTPPRSGPLKDLFRIALLASAAGTNTTYEQITGDLSNVNFSSYKAGALEFKRSCGRITFITTIPVFLDRIWGWFHKAGIDFGHFQNRPATIKWTPPPFESIDRKGDAAADILEMEAGLESRANLLNGRGYDEDEMNDQIAASRDKAAAKGLTFKGDIPPKPSKSAASTAL